MKKCMFCTPVKVLAFFGGSSENKYLHVVLNTTGYALINIG